MTRQSAQVKQRGPEAAPHQLVGARRPARARAPLHRLHDALGNHGVLRCCGDKVLRAKLFVGAAGDVYEQEANRLAAQVMRQTVGPVPQVRAAESAASGLPEAPSIVEQVLRSPGRPLDLPTRAFMEPRLGHNLSGVRVHTGPTAATSARAVGARAYTVGRDVVLGEGGADRRLLAHELVHVGQQSGVGRYVQRLDVATRRRTIVETAASMAEEHYLKGTGGEVPDGSAGVGLRRVRLDPTNHGAYVDVHYKEGKRTHVCGGRYGKVAGLPVADATNPEHQANPQRYRWQRVCDGEVVQGEACEGKRHFDCGGFVAFCYSRACPNVKYPGFASTVMTSTFGWNPVPKEQVEPGDIASTSGGGHVGICIDKTTVISALGKRWGVEYDKESYTKFGRLACLVDGAVAPGKAAEVRAGGVVGGTALRHSQSKVATQQLSVEYKGLSPELQVAGREKLDPPTAVFLWLQDQADEIVRAEQFYRVDRRAIAGAIAWEALMNPPSLLRRLFGRAPLVAGKPHVREHYLPIEGEPVAKQVEEAGYLPRQTLAGRKRAVATPAGAIKYIAGIMAAFADATATTRYYTAASRYGLRRRDPRCDPSLLTYVYQGVKDEGRELKWWVEHLNAKEVKTPLDLANDMPNWLRQHLWFIEAAVGTPQLPESCRDPGPSSPEIQRRTGTPKRR